MIENTVRMFFDFSPWNILIWIVLIGVVITVLWRLFVRELERRLEAGVEKAPKSQTSESEDGGGGKKKWIAIGALILILTIAGGSYFLYQTSSTDEDQNNKYIEKEGWGPEEKTTDETKKPPTKSQPLEIKDITYQGFHMGKDEEGIPMVALDYIVFEVKNKTNQQIQMNRIYLEFRGETVWSGSGVYIQRFPPNKVVTFKVPYRNYFEEANWCGRYGTYSELLRKNSSGEKTVLASKEYVLDTLATVEFTGPETILENN